MPPFGKTSALSHKANMKKVGIMCELEKPPGKEANKPSQPEIASIKKHFKFEFDLASLLMPTGLCSKHRTLLMRIERGEKTTADLPEPFDFNQLTIPTQTRGNTTKYLCVLCQLARGDCVSASPATAGSSKKASKPNPSGSTSSLTLI